jgi:hypothetical protein
MSDHPYHDLAKEVRRYFLDNPADPESTQLFPLSLHRAARLVIERQVTSSQVGAWLLLDAAQLSAPLQKNDERLELGGVDLFPAFIDILTYSIEAYLTRHYEDVRQEAEDRPVW